MASASILPNLYQGVEKGSFGYKMLATMGWKEGQGLGANKQGIAEHVKVKKKQDALGVGAAEHVHKLRDWTTGMVGFDAILTGLKEISCAPRSSSSDHDSSGSDHDSSSSEGHESGYASDSDTSAEVKKNSSKTAAGVAGFSGSDISADQPLSKKRKILNASVANHSGSKKKAKVSSSSKKQKKAGATSVAAGKPRKTSNQAASTAAAASDASDTSSSESDSPPDSETATDTLKQPAAAAAAVPPSTSRVKAASHLGRYQKREKAKTVRNYSATDLAAILGLPGSAPGAHTAEGAAGWAAATGISNPNGAAASSSSSSSDDSSSSDASDSDLDSSDQRLRPTTPPGSDTPPVRVLVKQQQQQRQGLGSGSIDHPDPAAAENAGAGSSSSWWRSVFVRADRGAGSARGSLGKKLINVSGFLEEDQTNLYMQAHEAAVKNKQGLGRSAIPKKVAGARWQGKKTKLGSDSEDEQQQQQQQQQDKQQQQEEEAAVAAAGRESYTKNGITIVMPIRRSEQQPQQHIGGDQQQQQRDREQQRKQERDSSGNGVKRKRKVNQQQVAAESDKPVAAAALAGHSSSKKKKKSGQQQHTAAKPARSTAAAVAAAVSRKVKWAKLAAKILEGAPKKRMRVQKLHKKVVAAAGYDVDAPGVDSEKLYQQMMKKLRKAEGLEVCDKYVAMA